MAFENIRDIVQAEEVGNVRNYIWRKTPSQATTAGLWFDLSMSPGSPPPKYWFDSTPLIAKAISRSQDLGFEHGPSVSPSTKYLRGMTTRASVATALPMNMIVCDYLLYYPSVDDSLTDPQEMDNSVTLPRYTDGDGVQMIAVTLASRTGGQTFSVSYTNSEGVSGRTSQTVRQANSATAIGTIATSATATSNSANPFIGLQLGDRGVRSIESVTMNGSDVGLFALILVKPLAQITVKEITTVYEKDFFLQDCIMPQVVDDAFISALCLPNGSLAATVLTGDLKVIWG